MTPEMIGELCRLSFKEGHGTITEAETAELKERSQVDHELSPYASALLNDSMTSSYRLGSLVARGEA